MRVRVEGRRQDSGQNIQDGHELTFTRQRQIDDFLDLAALEQRFHPFVFSARFLFSGMGRQLDAQPMQTDQTHVDRAVVLVEARVQFDLQAGNSRLIERALGARGKHRQARLCGSHFTSQELAFRAVQL